MSVGPRFEHDLTSNLFSQTPMPNLGSRIVACYTLRDPNYRVPRPRLNQEDSFEDGE